MKQRCEWCEGSDLEREYHDNEWGVPLHDDQKLFEFLILDAFQAGLSWRIVLQKRENFRAAFDQFNAHKIATYGPAKIKQLLQNTGIIRNRLKIEATIVNARAFLSIQEEFGSFDHFIWQFTQNKVLVHAPQTMDEIPSSSPESDALSKALKKRGFKFVGTTICYAFMQASGLINDHKTSCFRYTQLTTTH